MHIKNNNQDTELFYYIEIMDFFESNETDISKIEIWRSTHLIKLMDDLKNKRKSKEVIMNSLIIINALMEEIPTDTIHLQEDCVEELTLEDKNIIRSELERELLVV